MHNSQILTGKSSIAKISVLMPAYNAGKYIGESIGSILSQSYKNFELIVIDDASQDDTWEIISECAKQDSRIIKYKNVNNLKLSKTLNKGLEIAKGEYIVRMDADDVALPDRLVKQVNYMDHNPEVGISGGSMYIMNEKGIVYSKRKYNLTDREIRKKIFRYSPFSHPTIIMRKDIVDTVGIYDDYFNPAEDYELYFRIGRISNFGNLSDYLIKYRILEKSMTTGSTQNMEMKTIEIRNKFSIDPKYSFNLFDRVYNFIHLVALYIIPAKIRLTLFNWVRNSF